MNKELRTHLREEFVDTGFIQVFQWRNFEDYFEIEMSHVRKELITDFEQWIEKKWFNKCPEYEKNCSQCEFWKEFNKKFK